jgi:hypothetical protein
MPVVILELEVLNCVIYLKILQHVCSSNSTLRRSIQYPAIILHPRVAFNHCMISHGLRDYTDCRCRYQPGKLSVDSVPHQIALQFVHKSTCPETITLPTLHNKQSKYSTPHLKALPFVQVFTLLFPRHFYFRGGGVGLSFRISRKQPKQLN